MTTHVRILSESGIAKMVGILQREAMLETGGEDSGKRRKVALFDFDLSADGLAIARTPDELNRNMPQ